MAALYATCPNAARRFDIARQILHNHLAASLPASRAGALFSQTYKPAMAFFVLKTVFNFKNLWYDDR